jgi:hypothetical protein
VEVLASFQTGRCNLRFQGLSLGALLRGTGFSTVIGVKYKENPYMGKSFEVFETIARIIQAGSSQPKS